jgi:D-alanyl-D-alanine carboxypeptidase
MSKHTPKKHKGPANRNKGLQPSVGAAPKAGKKIETPEPEAKKTEAPKSAAQSKSSEPSKPKVKDVVKAEVTAETLEIEEPLEEAEVSKKTEATKKSFFAGIIENVKKMVKSG